MKYELFAIVGLKYLGGLLDYPVFGDRCVAHELDVRDLDGLVAKYAIGGVYTVDAWTFGESPVAWLVGHYRGD
jgi:hypothetical protein